MSNLLAETTWFTEKCPDAGSAFSFEVIAKLHSETTPYQTLDVYQTKYFGNVLTLDGLIQVTQRDNFLYHEMMAHPILFTHPNPEHVIIIGGGDCGVLHEVLKHKEVKQATLIDIDERVTRVAEQYFPELCVSNNDPRAQLEFTDGIQWIAQAPADSLDVIIIDSTDPVGPATGLFSAEFYRNCRRALKANGILIHQSESPLFQFNLIKAMRLAMRQAEFNHLQLLHFPQPTYPSGWWTGSMASTQTPLHEFDEQRVLQRTFSTQYYNSAIHKAALAQAEFLKNTLE
ncbi:MAG: polyamine aminopropyltransferase [Gammaproteobacteria bacterium]